VAYSNGFGIKGLDRCLELAKSSIIDCSWLTHQMPAVKIFHYPF
jgi:hypothetical protein